jgi:signal peptidase
MPTFRRWSPVLRPAAIAYLAALAGLLVMAIVPLVFGWSASVVASGSMAPVLRAGDVLVVAPVDPARVVPGQVVLVDDPLHSGRLLTHRVVRRTEDNSLVLKGDANAVSDSSPVAPSGVRGVGRLVVPRIGLPVFWLRTGDPRWVLWLVLTVLAVHLARPGPIRAHVH